MRRPRPVVSVDERARGSWRAATYEQLFYRPTVLADVERGHAGLARGDLRTGGAGASPSRRIDEAIAPGERERLRPVTRASSATSATAMKLADAVPERERPHQRADGRRRGERALRRGGRIRHRLRFGGAQANIEAFTETPVGHRTRRESPGRPDGPSMIPTDHYLRFERVDEVRETERGIEASLHGERLQVDLVTDDVVRIRISRGGSFDEPADVRRLRRPDGRTGRAPGRARRRCRPAAHERPPAHPRARPVPHRRAPSRRVTGRRDRRRRRRTPVGLRDPQRRVHGPPPVPPGGRGLRAGREDRPAQPQGPRLHDVEPRRAEPGAECRVHGRARSGRPAVGQLQHGVRPVLRVDPVLPPPRCPDLGRGLARSSTTATARTSTSPGPRSTGSTPRAGSTSSTCSPGRGSPTSSRRTRT